jgi:hypothetical protein
VLPLSSLSNIFLWKANSWRVESWCEAQPVPTFVEDIATFEIMWHYTTSFPIEDASMQQLTTGKKLLFCRTCQTKQMTLLDYFKK